MYGEEQPVVFPNFEKAAHPHVSVIEGDEVLTLRREEQGAQKLFVDTSNTDGRRLGCAMSGLVLALVCGSGETCMKIRKRFRRKLVRRKLGKTLQA